MSSFFLRLTDIAGNHLVIGIQDFGQCGACSSFTDLLIRVVSQ